MKKYLILLVLLLNLLPAIKICDMGLSTISAQGFASEGGSAYYCLDKDLGRYIIQPLPCDEEVCIQACQYEDCPYSGSCESMEFHIWVEHTNTEDPFANNEEDDPKTGNYEDNGITTGGYNGYGNNSSSSSGNTSSYGQNYNKYKALRMLSLFSENDTYSTKFSNLSKQKFVTALRNLINNPSKVQQGANGTCGAAVLCKFILESNPELFTRTAINMFVNGEYDLCNGIHLELPSSSFCGTEQQLATIGTTSVDAIMQGAIINSTNTVLNYNPFTDGDGLSSAMFPESIKLFCSYLGYDVQRENGHLFPTTTDTMTFDELCSYNIDFSNNFVIGYVHIDDGNFFQSTFASHYIQIQSVDNENRKICYWSWGENREMQKTDDYTGVAELIIVKIK